MCVTVKAILFHELVDYKTANKHCTPPTNDIQKKVTGQYFKKVSDSELMVWLYRELYSPGSRPKTMHDNSLITVKTGLIW